MRRGLFITGAAVLAIAGLGVSAGVAGASTVDRQATVTSVGAKAPSRPALKGRPMAPGAKSAAVIGPASLTYLYAYSYQYATAAGSSANVTIAKPFLDTADFHTLAEIAVQSADGSQIVEVGWIVDRGQFGDANPHLFVFHWIDGVPTCYNGCGFVSDSTTLTAGQTLPVSSTRKKFEIRHRLGAWYIGYNGSWFGHFPDSEWGGRYTQAGLIQWFGEVAANSAAPCTDMGNGKFASSTSAAQFTSIAFTSGPAVNITVNQSNPAYYSIVKASNTSMRYGGTGAC
ncbi:MAG: hypothetical protein AUI14_00430 [Actinobacteria bacterium 13_2_20CM_2_71_6]|nr:MAG: hypothetical protein AUI14_00430 [Actinobacteria bacterium 13_2_20CM_2_71_6]